MSENPLVHPCDPERPIDQAWVDKLWLYFQALAVPLSAIGTARKSIGKRLAQLSIWERTGQPGFTACIRAADLKGGREWVCYASGLSVFTTAQEVYRRACDPDTQWRESHSKQPREGAPSEGVVDVDPSQL